MTAPDPNLPRIHLHTLPHGTTLPDASTVADGWPFLLEADGERQLYQNFNGTWALVSGGSGLPAGGTNGQTIITDGVGDYFWTDFPTPVAPAPDGSHYEPHSTNTPGDVFWFPRRAFGPWFVTDLFIGNVGVPQQIDNGLWALTPAGNVVTDINDVATSSIYDEWMAQSADGTDSIASNALAGVGNSEVRAVCKFYPPAGKTMELFLRGGTVDGQNYYAVKIDDAGGITTVKSSAGTETTLATGVGSVDYGDLIQLQANGSTIGAVVTKSDGTQIVVGPTTDTTYDNTHVKVGMRMDGGGWSRFAAQLLP